MSKCGQRHLSALIMGKVREWGQNLLLRLISEKEGNGFTVSEDLYADCSLIPTPALLKRLSFPMKTWPRIAECCTWEFWGDMYGTGQVPPMPLTLLWSNSPFSAFFPLKVQPLSLRHRPWWDNQAKTCKISTSIQLFGLDMLLKLCFCRTYCIIMFDHLYLSYSENSRLNLFLVKTDSSDFTDSWLLHEQNSFFFLLFIKGHHRESSWHLTTFKCLMLFFRGWSCKRNLKDLLLNNSSSQLQFKNKFSHNLWRQTNQTSVTDGDH